MKVFKIFTILSITVLTSVIIFLFLNQKKIGFIDNSKVFSEFAMTKEIDKELKGVESGKKNILDSLIETIKKVESGVLKVEEKEYAFLIKQYEYKSNLFSEELTTMRKSEIEKIWKRINQYVAEYSKENNYYMVFGATGQGVLMYAKENTEITKEVNEYINQKYSGEK